MSDKIQAASDLVEGCDQELAAVNWQHFEIHWFSLLS